MTALAGASNCTSCTVMAIRVSYAKSAMHVHMQGSAKLGKWRTVIILLNHGYQTGCFVLDSAKMYNNSHIDVIIRASVVKTMQEQGKGNQSKLSIHYLISSAHIPVISSKSIMQDNQNIPQGN